ncbi:MAG: YggT family protein [Trichloromonadaceae bacterium]
MELVRDFILILAQMFQLIMTVYIYIVVARAIISWVNPDPYNPIVRFLHNVTDPVLYRIRKVIPLQFGGIDFTPILFLFGLFFIQRVVSQLLLRLASGI